MASTNRSREIWINSVESLVTEYHLTGIDIDWEYPSRSSSAGIPFSSNDVGNLFLLLQSLRLSLASTITLSAAISSSYPWSSNLTQFNELLDWTSLMDYNFVGPTNKVMGSTSPLQGVGVKNIEMGAKKWIDAGLSWGQLVFGIPGYGRAWIMEDVPPLCLFSPFPFVLCPLSVVPLCYFFRGSLFIILSLRDFFIRSVTCILFRFLRFWGFNK